MSERRKQNSRTDLMIPSCLHADSIKTQHKYMPNNILLNIIIHFAWISSGQTKSPFRSIYSIFIRGGNFSTIFFYQPAEFNYTWMFPLSLLPQLDRSRCVIWPRLGCKPPTSRRRKYMLARKKWRCTFAYLMISKSMIQFRVFSLKALTGPSLLVYHIWISKDQQIIGFMPQN